MLLFVCFYQARVDSTTKANWLLLSTSTDLWVPFSYVHYINSHVPIWMYEQNEYAEAVFIHNPEIQYVCKSIADQFRVVSKQKLNVCYSSGL